MNTLHGAVRPDTTDVHLVGVAAACRHGSSRRQCARYRHWSMIALGILLAVVAVIGFVQPAADHTGFERSNPADGALVEGEVTDVILVFTGPA